MTQTGRIALVTGGARGIGAATAQALATGGAHVIVADIRDDIGRKMADEICRTGGSAEYAHLDVSREEQWQSIVAAVCSRHGGLDIVVNNAGVEFLKLIKDITLDDWHRLMSINSDGVFLGTKFGIWGMTEGSTQRPQGGSIINVGSIASIIGIIGLTAYCGSKGAVRLVSKAAAVECALLKNGVRVNCVCPGFVKTGMLEEAMELWTKIGLFGSTREELLDSLHRMTPLGRVAGPQEVAQAITFLASEDSSFVTGTEILVDGGYTAV